MCVLLHTEAEIELFFLDHSGVYAFRNRNNMWKILILTTDFLWNLEVKCLASVLKLLSSLSFLNRSDTNQQRTTPSLELQNALLGQTVKQSGALGFLLCCFWGLVVLHLSFNVFCWSPPKDHYTVVLMDFCWLFTKQLLDFPSA